MPNNIIKLPDEENMHTHAFCPQCYYWLFGENKGSKYCPHCGIELFWDSEKAENYHLENYKFGIQRYNSLIKRKENSNGERNSN